MSGACAAGAFMAGSLTAGAATSIGVNFAGGDGGDGSQIDDARTLQPSQVAGVVPAANWNNAVNASGTLGSLVGSDVGITTATVTWASNGLWTARNTPLDATPDQILTNGYLDDNENAGLTTITFANLPFIGPYDVYLYYGSNENNRTGSATLGSTTIFFATNTSPFDGTFTAATPEDDGAADDGEYALFSGVTGSGFTVTVDRISDSLGQNVGVHGVQIVGIPEPTSVGLLSLGLLGLLARRRRSA